MKKHSRRCDAIFGDKQQKIAQPKSVILVASLCDDLNDGSWSGYDPLAARARMKPHLRIGIMREIRRRQSRKRRLSKRRTDAHGHERDRGEASELAHRLKLFRAGGGLRILYVSTTAPEDASFRLDAFEKLAPHARGPEIIDMGGGCTEQV